MQTIYLTHNDPTAAPAIRLMTKAFPSYTGRTFKLRVQETVNVRSYWDGGSRDYYAFVNLVSGQVSQEVPAQSAYDRPIQGADSVALVDGLGCVNHSIFCGKDSGLTLIIGPQNAPKYLPAAAELDPIEALVLIATASLKNTYGGETNIRYKQAKRHDPSLTAETWETAKTALIGRKLLTAAGAITPEGRNAVADHPLRNRIH